MIYERIKEICNAKGITIRKLEQDLEFGRRFWRGIIRTIWVGKDRSIRVEFLAISAGNN